MAFPTNDEIERALLEELVKAGGQVRPRDTYDKVARHFPQLTPQDLAEKNKSGPNKWTNTVQWGRQHLVNIGHISRLPRGVWTITDEGRKSLDAPFTATTDENQPTTIATVNVTPDSQNSVEADKGVDVLKPIEMISSTLSAIPREVEGIVQRLEETKRDSTNPSNFEYALGDAFRFLGYEVQVIGGKGDTDIALNAYLGAHGYRVVVDAKTSRTGKIPDSQINWPQLNAHKAQRSADYLAVAGETFSGGNLRKWAEEYHVSLFTTNVVIELLKMHDEAPFTLVELRDVFEVHGQINGELRDLKARQERRLGHWNLIPEILSLFFEYNRESSGGLAASPENISQMLWARLGKLADSSEVADALKFMSSGTIGAFQIDPGGSNGFSLVMHPQTVLRRIEALTTKLRANRKRDSDAEQPRQNFDAP